MSKLKSATIGAALAFAAVNMTGCGVVEYSEGARAGIPTKFSKKGIIFKTYEGQLAMANFGKSGRGETSRLSNSFNFSVLDESLVAKIEEARDNQQTVSLQYSQVLWPAPWVQDSEYVITGVKTVEGQKNKVNVVPGLHQ